MCYLRCNSKWNLEISSLEDLNKLINMKKEVWKQEAALTQRPDMSSGDSEVNSSHWERKKTCSERDTIHFGCREISCRRRMFHTGSLELEYSLRFRDRLTVQNCEGWFQRKKKKQKPMWPHYRGFVPTVIRNHKRHHSSRGRMKWSTQGRRTRCRRALIVIKCIWSEK